jgi:hypothetical protein
VRGRRPEGGLGERRQRDDGPQPDAVDAAARRWTRQVARGRLDAARIDRCLEVRYEDLALEPQAPLRRIAEFLELPWDGAVLDSLPAVGRRPAGAPGQPTPPGARPAIVEAPGRWRTEMSPEDRAACEAVAGDLLGQLGYEIGPRPALDGILQGRGTNPVRDG